MSQVKNCLLEIVQSEVIQNRELCMILDSKEEMKPQSLRLDEK